jgi:phosphate transport system substrate-binding protein
MSTVVKLALILLVGAGLCALVYYSPDYLSPKEPRDPEVPHLQTGGTSVAAFLMENRWGGLYRKKHGVQIDYASTGSTGGVERMINGEFAVGFTHAALTDKQRKEAEAKGGPVLHIPVVICGVVAIYNVKELKDKPPLKFTGAVLADIFLGKITEWDDPALKKLNEGVDLPHAPIKVVHRQDSSGTTFIFTDYLNRVSEPWRNQVGPAKNQIEWPVGVGKERNPEVADHIYRTPGTIGYVDRLFAGYGGLPPAAIQNGDRTEFVHAEAANMSAALESQLAALPDDLTFRLTNQSGKNAYPICGCVWAVCYQRQPASRKAQVTDFLNWIAHEGQDYANDMAYARLPEDLVRHVEQRINSITVAP